jgi:hypothetical protein
VHYLFLFYIYFGLQMASYWGMDMRGMFHRNDTETLVDKEVSQFLIKDLPWEDNLLIRQADGFISSLSRKQMIDWWAGKHMNIRVLGSMNGQLSQRLLSLYNVQLGLSYLRQRPMRLMKLVSPNSLIK